MFEMADSAFLGGMSQAGTLGSLPRVAGTPVSAGAAVVATASRAENHSADNTLAQQVMTVAAVCGILAAATRKRWGGRRNQTRIPRGPTGGCWHEYTFRAKAGAKYKYRVSTDKYTPEWGHWPPDAEGRLIRYGLCLRRGKPQGPAAYAKKKAEQEAAAARRRDMAPAALIFDCDGTLVETERDGHRVAFNKAFKELGYDCEWEVGLYGELLTTGGGKERMARYFKDYNPDAWKSEDEPTADHPAIKELHKLKTKLFMEIVRAGQLPLREGIEELIAAADEAGWKLAVCSTSNEEAVKAVVETYLPQFADRMPVFAGDVVSKKKPDPEIYTLAAKELGLAPMKCVVVEDTEIGLQAGKAAGMQVIITKSIYSELEDFSAADIVVTSAAEIDFEEDVAVMVPELEEMGIA